MRDDPRAMPEHVKQAVERRKKKGTRRQRRNALVQDLRLHDLETR